MELNIPIDRSIIFYLEDKNVSQRKRLLIEKKMKS